MKRSRVEASNTASASFSFQFPGSAPEDAVPSIAATGTAAAVACVSSEPDDDSSHVTVDRSGIFARTTEAIGEITWGSSSVSSLKVPKGDVVRIDWDDSEHSFGCLQMVTTTTVGETSRSGVVDSQKLSIILTARDIKERAIISGDHDFPSISVRDVVFQASHARRQQLGGAAALTIEPGLAPLSWPLRAKDFLCGYFGSRALCVHGGARRLVAVAKDFAGFDARAMLADAAKTVVWMRDASSGAMQYVEADATLGAAAWAAGHSLYFNPSAETSRKYISQLAEDLGMACSTSGDDSVDAMGDVEVFAVRGRHSTPWHWDAQDNFTLQCKGMKRWRLKRGPIVDPLTNWHPKSASLDANAADARVHGACVRTSTSLIPPADGDEEVVTVLLRPGSMLYVPAGWWHSVEAESDEGSFSINMSMAGLRYSDVLLRSLAQRLWGKRNSGWRARVIEGPQVARQKLQALLRGLAAEIDALDAHEMLPDDSFFVHNDGSASESARKAVHLDIVSVRSKGGAFFKVNPGAVLTLPQGFARADGSNQPFFILRLSSGFGGAGPEFSSVSPLIELDFHIPESISPAVKMLLEEHEEVALIEQSVSAVNLGVEYVRELMHELVARGLAKFSNDD
jgi:ribosomal protein L16 Arg81 hydroxylase